MTIVQTRSQFSVAEAQHLAHQWYGLTVTAAPLPSERDQNFHLTAAAGAEYVLKIARAGDSPALLDFQNQAIERLNAHGLFSPPLQIHRTLAGQTIATVPGHHGADHAVRLLTYLPGRPLALVKPHSPELLGQLGAFLGRLDAALVDFTHPAAHQDLQWDVAKAGEVIRRHLEHIADPDRRAIVAAFLARFESGVQPHLPALRQSIIQNDANDYNVLVETGHLQPSRLVGVIDFGDMLHSYPIYELAIAAAYAILDKADPLAAAVAVTAGYHAAYPLPDTELALLYDFIAIRLCTSVAVSACQQKLEPDNAYLRISEAPAWAALQKWRAISPALAHFAFRHACGLAPHPAAEAIVQWLTAHQSQLAPVVQPDLRTATSLVLDWSVGSLDFPDDEIMDSLPAFTAHIFARMEAADATAGIGRYNEPRLVYTTDQFQVATDELPESRTIHLGLDIFQPAGSPVFAPIEGVVRIAHNNTAPKDYGPVIVLEHTVPGVPPFFTLYGHLTPASLAGVQVGQTIGPGQQFAAIGNFPDNGNWAPHLHFQIVTHLLGHTTNFPGVARPAQRDLWLNLCPDPNLLLGIPARFFPAPPLAAPEILQSRRAHLGPSLSISYQKPLTIVRGAGQYLYDDLGRAYLDAVNNVPHVGHNHPHVVRAGQRQMAVLNTNTRYLHPNLVRYAERLTAAMPAPLSVCFFVCSGSEANDLALRLARAHTGQRDIITLDGAYHGNLTSLIDISPYKYDGPGGAGKPAHVRQALMPDPYRGRYRAADPQAGEKYAAHVQAEIEAIQAEGRNVAAFIAESVLGCGGQVVLPPGYLAAAYRHVRAAGGVCLADEVQVGFGRVGTHFWGFQTQEVVPDIVTLGKPMGNGHPLAAVVTTPEIAASFANGMEYFNTFGGNPVSCAIGLAVLEVVEQEGLQQHALEVGRRMLDGLAGLQEKHPLVGDVRGLGLFVGIELVRNRVTLEPAAAEASYIAERMRDHGILISTDGPLHNVLKIKPPLVFSAANADRLVATLDRILQEDAVQG
jgi:4-aminobutyrate aminotransferase-like enzyme/Ser/Thr protein kinase RdoA (MazF antagonist)